MPTTTVRFRLSATVFFALGLDDHGVITQVYPSFKIHNGNLYEADRGDAVAILDAITDRAAPDSGYEHTASERRALEAAAIAVRFAVGSAAHPHQRHQR